MIKLIKKILKENKNNIVRIWRMASVEQRKAYRGSDLGRIWAYLKPAIYVFGFYVALSVGFRSAKDIAGIHTPYFIWLATGMVSWFYMRDLITGGANCFGKYKFMHSKGRLPMTTMPTVPAMVALRTQLVLLAALIVLNLCYGCMPNKYWLQLPFYMFMMVIMSIAWGFFAGCITVLSKDLFNILRSVNMMIMWLSGIMFDTSKLAASSVKAKWIFRLNPVTYIAEGYRNCFCREVWFFEEKTKLYCFLFVMLLFTVCGLTLYKRMEKELPDIV